MRHSPSAARRAAAPALALGLAVFGGGAVAAPLPPGGQAWPDWATPAVASTAGAPTPAVRRGRYTLVELVPDPAQRDLMRQVVEVSMPSDLDATVGDGLRHVLLRSGYRLCTTAGATALYALPLPAAHLHLGPLMLRDALLTLAGPAWDLSVDDAARRVCFTRHASVPLGAASPASAPAGAAPARAKAPADGEHEEAQP